MTTENYLQLKSLLLRDTENKKSTVRFISIMLGIFAIMMMVGNFDGYIKGTKEIMAGALFCGSLLAGMFCFGNVDLRLQRLDDLYKQGANFDIAAKDFGLLPK
ncbi:MAG: hypothetical protein WCL18_01225 [bacterium]